MSNKAQKRDILPKLWCQKCSATRGNIAMDNKIPTKGKTHKIPKFSPFRWGAPSAPAKTKEESKKKKKWINLFLAIFYLQ